MKRFFPSGLIFFAGVLGIATVAAQGDQDVTKIRKKLDLRESILRKFLKARNCPDQEYAELFQAAVARLERMGGTPPGVDVAI